MNSLLFVVLSALFLDPNARAASIGNSLWSPKLSMLERLGLFRRQNQHSFPMDPNTVVTFEPEFPCPKMKSRIGNPPRSLLLKLLEKIRGPQFRIYYGVEVEEGEMPFLAAYNNDIVERATPSCTASIWTRNHIVTAAHCLGPTNPCVYVGSPNIDKAYKLQRSDLISLIQHPDFYNAPLQADFGVITTVKPLPLEEGKIQPSCLFLGDKRIWKSEGPLPEKVVAMGWGLMETEYDPHPLLVKRPKTARKRWIHVVDCDWIPNDKPGCHAYHLCQDNTEGGACQGDSGAPIVGYEKSLESWVQVGVHSMRNDIIMPHSPTGNPWCDFLTKHIPLEAHLVIGSTHPSEICNNPDKWFEWCDFQSH